MTLGERISKKRKEMGMSQEELGNELNVSRQAIYKWETDQSMPELDKLKQLASLFDVSIGWLLNEEEIKRETVVETQYVEVPKKEKTIIYIAVIAVILFVFAFGRIGNMEKKYNDLYNMIQTQGWNTTQQISGIFNRIQEYLETKEKISVSSDVVIKGVDYETNEIVVDMKSTPKTITNGMSGEFVVESGDDTFRLPVVLSPNGSFEMTARIPLTDNMKFMVSYITGSGENSVTTNEILDEFNGLYTNSFGFFYAMSGYATFMDTNGEFEFMPGDRDFIIAHEMGYAALQGVPDSSGNIKIPVEIGFDNIEAGIFEDGVLKYSYERNYAASDNQAFYFLRPEKVNMDTKKHRYGEGFILTDNFGRTVTVIGW